VHALLYLNSDASDVADSGVEAAKRSGGSAAVLQSFINSDAPSSREVTLDALETCFPYRFDRFQVRGAALPLSQLVTDSVCAPRSVAPSRRC
jgi:hypothetical protein